VPSYGARHRRIGAEYGAIVQTEAAKAIEHHPAPLAIRVRWGSACIRRLCFSLESSATPQPPTGPGCHPSSTGSPLTPRMLVRGRLGQELPIEAIL
jgi:hypothetical protein